MIAFEQPALVVHDPASLHAARDAFLQGWAPLTAVDFYYCLERASSLLSFHTMLRSGPRNRTRDGLQQSYGDHNRLLMLALDRLLAGDVEWLRSRAAPEGAPDDASLRRCVITSSALQPSSAILLALWLGAGLHDCGMLCGQDAHADVEDGLALARPVLIEYCPADVRPLAEFALRHHDYIKDSFLGEIPVGLIADELDQLDPSLRTVALAALGLIQVAGASSLGEGRLTRFRLRIFDACLGGTAVADRSSDLRLARLLAPSPDPDPDTASPPDVDAARSTLASLAPRDRSAVEAFLAQTAVHRWHAFVGHASTEVRMDALRWLATANDQWLGAHIVIDDSLRGSGDGRFPSDLVATAHTALSGRTVVTLSAPAAVSRHS